MKKLMPIITLILIITCCTESKTNLSIREIAISLIEKEYKVDGRKLEYSQVDSTDAELKGYSITRIYINNDDSIKVEEFHINFNKTKVNLKQVFNIETELYKLLSANGKVFSNDSKEDSIRIRNINRKYYHFDAEKLSRQQQYIDSVSKIEGQNNKY